MGREGGAPPSRNALPRRVAYASLVVTPPSPSPAPSRPTLARGALVRVVGMLALLAFVAWRVDLATALASWRGLEPLAAAGAGAAFSLAMVVRALKWDRQARAVGLVLRPGESAYRFLLGVLLGVVTPLRLGELTRLAALDVPPDARTPTLARAAGALLLEKVVEVIVLGSLASIGAWVVFPGTPAGPLASAGVLLLTALVLGNLGVPRVLARLLPPRLVERVVTPVLSARDGLAPGARAELLALSFVAQLLNTFAGWQVYRAFGDMPFLDVLHGMPLLTFTAAVPLTISGIGLRETVAMEVFGGAGYPAASAALAASLVFVGANVLPAVVLLPLAALVRRSRQNAPKAS